ncbi:MAG TPA: hypothetical protein VIW94_12375 [Acidimicrobiia bacterium]
MTDLAKAVSGKVTFHRPLIVIGGPDENGNRVASDVVESLKTDSRGVIRLDGWSEHPAGVFEKDEHVIVLYYGDMNRRRFLARLANRSPGSPSRLGRGLRKLDTATKGYLSWRLIAAEAASIASIVEPDLIVYCDDHSLTTAWHLADIWPASEVRRA